MNVDLRIEKLVFEGWGLAHGGDATWMVGGVLPGEVVTVEPVQRKRGVCFARPIAWRHASPDRRPPPCPHYQDCGGCPLMHARPAAQAALKESMLYEALERHLPPSCERRPIIPSAQELRYRNKMSFTIGAAADGKPVFGLHPRGDPQRLLPTPECKLPCHPPAGLFAVLRQGWSHTPPRDLPRRLDWRASVARGDRMAVLHGGTADAAARAAEAIAAQTEQVVWIPAPHSAARPLRGADHLVETLGGGEFEIPAAAFFQTNIAQAEALVGVLRRELECAPPRRLLDLYAGVGALGLALARPDMPVALIESQPEAAAAAGRNARRNGRRRARALTGDAAALYASLNVGPDDLALLDPPRGGLDPRLRAALARRPPRQMVYISCHPATLARDLGVLRAAAGLRAGWVQPLDFFPQTHHVETAVGLNPA